MDLPRARLNSTGASVSADSTNDVNLSVEMNRGRLNSSRNSETASAAPLNVANIASVGSDVARPEEMSTDELDVNLLFGAEDVADDQAKSSRTR